jgi:hypothetical protein
MWFAALGSINQNPWLLRLAIQLLKNNSDVLALIDKQSNTAFQFKPPTFIRANAYDYKFTQYTTNNNHTVQLWWQRKFDHEYFPMFSLNDSHIQHFLNQYQIKGSHHKTHFAQIIETLSRYLVYLLPDFKFLGLALSVIALIVF